VGEVGLGCVTACCLACDCGGLDLRSQHQGLELTAESSCGPGMQMAQQLEGAGLGKVEVENLLRQCQEARKAEDKATFGGPGGRPLPPPLLLLLLLLLN
jgi:hypothetical protein